MRPILMALTCCLGLPVSADTVPLKIEGCESSTEKGALRCSFTNTSEFAVGVTFYRFVLREEGRTYPWHTAEGSVAVPGGIEPGETVELAVGLSEPAPDTQKRMEGRDIIIEKTAWAQGLKFKEPGSGYEILGSFFSRCWNVGSLSTEALQTSITVIFNLSDARVDTGSIKPKAPIATTAEKQAYEAARRAIIRCGARGVPTLPSGYAGGLVEMTFDAQAMRVK
ncbi:Cell division and transport-associated protein TolA (plasmid) [Phaeobacter piscinae]|uniref:Cell division and transport-associated protein TolA n=1 Tax=Phaeobacter piscinae TaxID=1580596 RepID=A0ABM6PJX7_9RHOB|nr:MULTISPECIES: hypothetical protein [Phaeobacter]ATG38118.1 Cell division and transport-associated protein TolA [Phaeobacter piscinae]AUQ88639.1 Cell division and transport-associated protein TolA [Phaeobacter piscinae]AUQ92638.1 Cell division and transport-associated protein TolA [Phaeobacter inhibens]AUR26444.1 Cell division and transport-associated protein TolA [Phaeobacter piscinae]